MDSSKLLGLTIAEAKDLHKKNNIYHKGTLVGSIEYFSPDSFGLCDFIEDRLIVYTENGIITEIDELC